MLIHWWWSWLSWFCRFFWSAWISDHHQRLFNSCSAKTIKDQPTAYAGNGSPPPLPSFVTLKVLTIWNSKRLINKQNTANCTRDNWRIERRQLFRLNTDGETETQTNTIRLSLSVVWVRWGLGMWMHFRLVLCFLCRRWSSLKKNSNLKGYKVSQLRQKSRNQQTPDPNWCHDHDRTSWQTHSIWCDL